MFYTLIEFSTLLRKIVEPYATINFVAKFCHFKTSRNFAIIEDVGRKYNLMVDLSKFTSNKNISNETVVLSYNQVYWKTLSIDLFCY